MSNWTTITIDDLKAAGHGDIIDAAQTVAVGANDPVAEAIAGAVSKIRGAVSSGNALDANPAKVPNSLKALGMRIALFALMSRIQMALDQDQRDDKKNDESYLHRIIDNKIRFELPDTPAGSAEMQPGMSVGIVIQTRREATRHSLKGLC